MSTIQLRWTDRKLVAGQTPRRFLDLVIDGRSLYEIAGDLIPPLGWLEGEENLKAVNRLLLKGPPDLPNERISICVCPECGGLGCGAVSVVIERVGEMILWKDFGYQNNYDETVQTEDWHDVGPFSFDAAEYQQTIGSALNKQD